MAQKKKEYSVQRFCTSTVVICWVLGAFVTAFAAETNWCSEYGRRREYDKQIQACTAAIKSGKLPKCDLPNYYHNRATAQVNVGSYDEAISDFSKAIELNARHAPAHAGRGKAYHSVGSYDEAISDFSKAIELAPKDPYITSYAYLGRADSLSEKSSYDRAINDYASALRINPKDPYVYNNRGSAYVGKGNYDRAINDYNRAIQIDPKSAQPYVSRGLAFYFKGDYNRALSDFDKAVRLDPMEAMAYRSRAITYYGQGDYNRALSDFDKAVNQDPDDEYSSIMTLLVLRKISEHRARDYMKELGAFVRKTGQKQWIRSISQFYLGANGKTEKSLLEEARGGRDEKQIRDRLCQANYYLGEERLWKGDSKGAADFFRKSIQTRQYALAEYHTSKAMLRKMGINQK